MVEGEKLKSKKIQNSPLTFGNRAFNEQPAHIDMLVVDRVESTAVLNKMDTLKEDSREEEPSKLYPSKNNII